MAESPEPPEEDGAPGRDSDEPTDGWVRPSQRRPRPSKPPPEPPVPRGPSRGGERPRPRRTRPNVRPERARAAEPLATPGADDETAFDPIDDLNAGPPTARGGANPAPVTGDDEPTAVGAGVLNGTRRSGRAHRSGRAQRSARGRRRALAGAAALVLLIGVIAVVAAAGGGGASKASKHLKFAPLTTPTTGPRPPALIATTKGGPLLVYDQPNGKVVSMLSAKTDYQLPRTVLATSSQPNWLQVLLPQKPNDSTGWVKGSDVTMTTTDYSMRVSLGQHHIWLYKAGAPVVDSAVVIGKKETPTPTGLFYVTDPVDLQSQPNGPYGAFALGLSGYSNVLPSFDGGPPQIAVHGTPFPDQVGQDISNGCVRVPSPIILQIAKLVPLGTPVTIQA